MYLNQFEPETNFTKSQTLSSYVELLDPISGFSNEFLCRIAKQIR